MDSRPAMAIFELLDYIVNEVRAPAAFLELFPDNTRALSQMAIEDVSV